MDFNKILGNTARDLGHRPPPPELPKYDPELEAPKWSRSRLNWNIPVDKGPKPWGPVGNEQHGLDDPDWRGVLRGNVIEYPMPEEYKFGAPIIQKYFWFDTPDYADPFKKLGYAAKFFLFSGTTAAALVGGLRSFPFTLGNSLHLLKSIAFPWFVSGMASSAVIIAAANLRGEKDDYTNYLIGATTMGTILGRKNHMLWVQCMTVTVPGFLFVKYVAEHNGSIVPIVNVRSTRNILSPKDAEHGLVSGDLRHGLRGTLGDPGRDLRRTY